MNDRARVRWLSASASRPSPRTARHVSAGKVTLLFGAHDIEHNGAVTLADYLAAN
jgi:uncharacterized protein YeaO (DUF488 family)